MPKLYFVDFHWTPPSMVVDWLRSSCFNQTVRCSSRRVRLAQRQGLVYTQHHRDISQAYKTTTIRADAQEIVQPMHSPCFTEIHWTPPSMGVNQPPSQCPAQTVRCSSRRVRWRQTHSWNRAGNHRNPARAFNTTPASTDPQNARPPTHMHSCQQQWNSHPATVQGSTQSAPHKRQWKTPWTKSVNHPNASDQPNQRVEQNRTNAPQCSPQLNKIAQIRSKRQLKPRKNTQKHRKARFCSSKVTFCACYPGKW